MFLFWEKKLLIEKGKVEDTVWNSKREGAEIRTHMLEWEN